MPAKRRIFRIERLESREMKAGDVAANIVNGDLILTEAMGQTGLDNAVTITQTADGKIRVASNSTNDGSMSRINGHDYQDFTVTGGLKVNFGGGNDLVVIGPDAINNLPNPSFNNVDISMGAPPPVATQGQVASKTAAVVPSVFYGPDKDNVIVWGMNVRGTTKVNTGVDSDWVYIANSKLGDGVGVDDVTINTGAGADTAQLKNLNGIINGKIDVQLYSNVDEADADVAWLDKAYAYGNVNIRAGAGNDTIHVYDSTAYLDMSIDAGVGDDTVDLSGNCAVQNFFASLGAGNDTLTVRNLYTINGKTTFDGGAGSDRLNRSGVIPTQQLTQTNWEWINGLPILTVLDTVAAKPVSARL